MRQAARTKGSRSQVARVISLPAPVGGWNARDSLGAMDGKDAVILENWFPATTEVMLRKGYTEHATGLPGDVETLMAYSGPTSDKLFAVSTGNIYDVTSSGAVGAAAVSSLANSRFEHINISTSGGNFLLAVNGADKMRIYNGTSWDYDGAGSFTVTGFNTQDAAQICLHKNRVWLVQKDTLKVWYLPTSSIAGAANQIDLAAVARLGGYLVAMGTWTIDAGYGVDDHAVFVTSNGEIIVYKGTDPSSPSTWALVGVWQLGSPVGRRCLQKYAGDLLIICQDGILPLSGALQSSRLNPRVALTDKIQYAVSEAITAGGDQFGWEILLFPKANQLYLNVVRQNVPAQQYVMNTITKSWCKFTGWDANCWELFQDMPYYGTSTKVCAAWNTNSDNSANIAADGLQAFSYFGSPGQLKKFGMARPIMRADSNPTIRSGINVDFDTGDTAATLNFTSSPYAVWDTGVWDAGLWGGELSILKEWQTVAGVGYSAGMRVKTASSTVDLRWVSTDITLEPGGVL